MKKLEDLMPLVLERAEKAGESTLVVREGARAVEFTIKSRFVPIQSAYQAFKKRQAAERESAFDEADVYAVLCNTTLGRTLSDAARQMGVSPRNKLLPYLNRLIERGKVVKAGRYYRPKSLVVRRGPKPKR